MLLNDSDLEQAPVQLKPRKAASFLAWFCSFLVQVREFLLEQPDAYEIKIGERLYRRPGDPPREELVKLLQKEKADSSKGNKLPKEEL